MSVWTAEEVQLFLERTKGTHDYPLWHTLFNTGLRPGEALGLKWSDLQGDRLHVVRAVVEGTKKGTFKIDAPKTERSKRAIALTPDSLAVLSAHRKAQAEAILKAGPEYDRQDFIFAPEKGGHDIIPFVRRRWQRAIRRVNRMLEKEDVPKGAEKVKLKDLRLYDTRHTHATMLLKAGVHAKVVSERLGHTSIVITLDTYSHILPDMQDEAVGKLTALMQANGGK
jgi:integrase